MRGKNRVIIRLDLILACLGWILAIGNLFNGASIFIIHVNNDLIYTLFPVAYLGIAATFLYHFPALAFLVRVFRKTDRFLLKHWLILIVGVLSAMAPLLEWAALGDVFDNIQNGLPSLLDDSSIYIAAVLHVAFIFILLKQIYSARRRGAGENDNERIDDTVFKIVHGVGMMSNGLGFLFCCFQAFFRIPSQYRPFIVGFYSVAFFAPYAITLFIWRKTLRKAGSKVDEKQRTDIAAGSFKALWSVLGVGLLIYLAGGFVPDFPERIQWYPSMFFAGLFAFSFSVFRRSLISGGDTD